MLAKVVTEGVVLLVPTGSVAGAAVDALVPRGREDVAWQQTMTFVTLDCPAQTLPILHLPHIRHRCCRPEDPAASSPNHPTQNPFHLSRDRNDARRRPR